MDPIITAAWITGAVAAVGIAGTVVSSMAGSRNTRMVHRYRMMGDNGLASQSARPGGAPYRGRELVAARKDVDAAIADAQAMDDALVKLIREAQRSGPEAAAPPPAPPRNRESRRRRE